MLALRTAGSEVDISPCYATRCSGSMRLRKNQKGFLLSCSVPTCKAVWWVPKFVRSGLKKIHTLLNSDKKKLFVMQFV